MRAKTKNKVNDNPHQHLIPTRQNEKLSQKVRKSFLYISKYHLKFNFHFLFKL